MPRPPLTRTPPLIAGALVYLRHPEPTDADEYLALRRRSRQLHAPWEPLPPAGMPPYGIEAFARLLDNADTPHSQKHLLCRITDHAIVGYVGLNQIHMEPLCSAFMGYWVGAPYTRLGYGADGVRATLTRAFTQLGLHRVEANIMPENLPSLSLARRCGFRKEGFSPRYLRIAGAWRDHERWALTIEDWHDPNAPGLAPDAPAHAR